MSEMRLPSIERRSTSGGEWSPWSPWLGYLEPVADLLAIEHFESVVLRVDGGNVYEYRRVEP